MEEYSLRSQVFQRIREDILCGVYEENEELREATIGKELGVSRTPVREALRQLELEGLVKIIPNKGAYVTGISQKDVHDIYNMRILLEQLCARWATEHITEEQLDAMDEILLLSEHHLRKKHFEQLSQLDSQFHGILYEAAGSRFLCHELTGFHKYVQMSRKISVENEERAKMSLMEHRALLDALHERDAEKAEEAVKVHISRVMKNLNIEE